MRPAVFSAAWLLCALSAWAAPSKPLAIVRPTLYEYDGGPPLQPDATFRPGYTVFFSFQVVGYKAGENGSVRLQYRIEAVDTHDTALMEPISGEVKTELAPEDKNWLPLVRQSVPVPPLTDPGTFHIRITVKDELADTEATGDIPFQVTGRQIAPSDTLTVRDFQFYRGENDTSPLSVAAYRPGDSLWARFAIVGYRLGEKNHVHVAYGLSVLGPSGKSLYSEPQAAVEDTSSFYPKRYLTGSLSLNLQRDARPGDYTIVLTVRDELGSQTFEGRYGFKIE